MAIDDNANYTLTGAQVKDLASEVNKKVEYVDIEATTPVPAVETAMIADGAVTPAKLSDTGWVLADQYINTTYFSPRTHIYYRILAGVVYWRGAVYCHTAPSSSDHTANLLTGLPNSVMPVNQVTVCGLQFMIPDGEYQMWTENNGIRVWESRQQIPATYDFQGYDLSQFKYIPSGY